MPSSNLSNLNARLQLLTLVWTLLLAPPTTVLLLAPALAHPVPAAHLHHVLPEGRDAGLVAGAALASRKSLHVPHRSALARPTEIGTCSFRTRTRHDQSLSTALPCDARTNSCRIHSNRRTPPEDDCWDFERSMKCFLFHLVAVFPGRAFTLSTNAAATIVAQCCVVNWIPEWRPCS